jgi:uncharacterized protein (TIGR03118 family)
MDRKLSRSRILSRASLVAALLAGGCLYITTPADAGPYQLTSLVTDDNTNLTSLGFPMAAHVDPNLLNPWGVSFTPTSPFWVSDNASGFSTLYTAAGVQVSPPSPVTIADAASPAAPTGQVFNNNTSDFIVTNPGTGMSGSANFIFATENGTISGRSGTVGANSQSFIGVDCSVSCTANPAGGAVYKGLAIATIGSSNVLFATNFNSGMIEEYDSSFGFVKSFTDPHLPSVPVGTPAGQNWAPFNVQLINGQLYVTYALQNAAKHDDVAGEGNGFVDVFALDGTFVKRLINFTGVTSPLDSPWGLAIAPAGFGTFANDLLVGNFGNGEINAFDPNGGTLIGTLDGSNGSPIVIPGLWDLTMGNGGAGVDPNGIYFTAGLPDFDRPQLGNEQEGLFGRLDPVVPEPGSLALLATGLTCMMWLRRRPKITARSATAA